MKRLALALAFSAVSIGAVPAAEARVVVRFKGRVDGALVLRHGGREALSIDGARAVAAEVPLERLAGLRLDPNVASVELDLPVSAVGVRRGDPDVPTGSTGPSVRARGGSKGAPQPAQIMPWGIGYTYAHLVWHLTRGEGVKVAVIDTGIDDRHPDLAGHVVLENSANFIQGKEKPADAGGVPAATGKPPRDDNGHGTHVSGTLGAIDNGIGVVGVAPETILYAVKVLDRNGDGWTSTVSGGIYWAVRNGMQVASMSLGGEYSEVTEIACREADAAGVLLVAAAGNKGAAPAGQSNIIYPAAFPSVVCVGGMQGDYTRAWFSCTGPEMDLVAPGVNTLSTVPGGGYEWEGWNGTSMATPHVSGSAALLFALAPRDLNGNGRVNDEVRDLLFATAGDIGDPSRDPVFGHGCVNAMSAVLAALR